MNNDSIREYCLTFAGAYEEVKWESDLCFCVAGKIFCMITTHVDFSVLFKCSDEQFTELCEREWILPAPYLARNKWVCVQRPNALNREEWKYLIASSYQQITAKFSRKLRSKLGLP